MIQIAGGPRMPSILSAVSGIFVKELVFMTSGWI